jgi:hypothetical protein
LYWLGQGAYEKPDPYAIFDNPADAFKYFVHISDFGDPSMCIVPITIQIPVPNPKHTYNVYLPHLPPLDCKCTACERVVTKKRK